jgi:hypothetical protein
MAAEHEQAMVGRAVGGVAVQAPGAPRSGTVATPEGPISWSLQPDGTLSADGGGQQLRSTVSKQTDGALHGRLTFSQANQNPYLTIQSVVDEAHRAAAITVGSGQSTLTLTISDIDPSGSSATATVSGSLAAASESPAAAKSSASSQSQAPPVAQTVEWTGHVDLTANPLSGKLIPGWPPNAFSSELKTAAFFVPLAKAVSWPSGATPGQGGGHETAFDHSTTGSTVKGLIVGAAAALGVFATGGGLLAAVVVGGLGFDATVWSDVIDDWDSEVEAEPPVIDLPPDSEPTGPSTSVSQEDPPSGGQDPGSTGQEGSGDGGDVGGDSGGDSGGGGATLSDDQTGHKQD